MGIDRRATPRFRVQFRTAFSGSPAVEGTGTIVDLSLGGCRVESPALVRAGLTLEVRIHAPDLDWPLMIDGARVQWVNGETFGLAFLQVRDTEGSRLQEVIAQVSTHREEQT